MKRKVLKNKASGEENSKENKEVQSMKDYIK
jgi:hypothetical protein